MPQHPTAGPAGGRCLPPPGHAELTATGAVRTSWRDDWYDLDDLNDPLAYIYINIIILIF